MGYRSQPPHLRPVTISLLSGTPYPVVDAPTYSGVATALSFTSTSDARKKKNIEEIGNATERIEQIKPITFQWKVAADDSDATIGVIAQDLKTVMPGAVHTGADGFLSVDYNQMIPLLVGAQQESNKLLKRAREEIDELQQEVKRMRSEH